MNMASAAGTALLRAIEGYRGAHGGERGHENIMAHLERAHKEVVAGKANKDLADSPGRREVGLAAHAREMPAEHGHEGSEGTEKSMRPSPYPGPAERPGVIAPGGGGENKMMTAAAGVESRGNTLAAKPGPAAPSGAVSFRTVATQRAAKFSEPSKTSAGNRISVTPGDHEPEEKRVGNVPPVAKAGADRNRLEGNYEKEPAYVGKEKLGGDRWERAAQGVRKQFAKTPR